MIFIPIAGRFIGHIITIYDATQHQVTGNHTRQRSNIDDTIGCKYDKRYFGEYQVHVSSPRVSGFSPVVGRYN